MSAMTVKVIQAAMFLLTAGLCAINVVFYVSHHNPINLGSAIFCGFAAVFQMATR